MYTHSDFSYSVKNIVTSNFNNIMSMFLLLLLYVHSLSFNRQHLSYDVCLEVRREIIRTVLCCNVYGTEVVHSHKHTKMQFLQFSGLGFCLTGPISLCIDSFLFYVFLLAASVILL